MTTNQIKWAELREGQRHNVETEAQGRTKLRQDYEIGSRQAGAAESQAAAAHRNAGANESNAVTNRINAATRQAELGESTRHNQRMEDIGQLNAEYPYYEWTQGGGALTAAKTGESKAKTTESERRAAESEARTSESQSKKKLLDKQVTKQTVDNIYSIGTLPSRMFDTNMEPANKLTERFTDMLSLGIGLRK